MKWSGTALGWSHDMGRIGWLEIITAAGNPLLLWSNHGTEIALGEFDSVEAAKAAAIDWTRHVVTQLANTLADVERMDDGE